MESYIHVLAIHDLMPDWVAWFIFFLIPIGLLAIVANPLISVMQLSFLAGAIAFVVWRVARRLRKKEWWDFLDTLCVVGAGVAAYLLLVPATNLLLFLAVIV